MDAAAVFCCGLASKKKKAIYVAVTELDRTSFALECDLTN
jgi:hypothetical protein